MGRWPFRFSRIQFCNRPKGGFYPLEWSRFEEGVVLPKIRNIRYNARIVFTIQCQTHVNEIFKCTIFVGNGGVIQLYWCYTMWRAKTLIRLCRYSGRSEFSLYSHVILLVISQWSSINFKFLLWLSPSLSFSPSLPFNRTVVARIFSLILVKIACKYILYIWNLVTSPWSSLTFSPLVVHLNQLTNCS